MPVAVVHLQPRGSVVGAPPPSPTLYGALCWATAVLYGEEQAQAMAQELTCTDAFPLAHSGQGYTVRFFPMPVLPQPVTPLPERTLSHKQQAVRQLNLFKRLKRARYLSEGLFTRYLQGDLSASTLADALQEGQAVLRGNCLMLAQEAQDVGWTSRATAPLASADVTRNEIDRWSLATAEGRMFLREETFFAPGVGLWFGVHLPEEQMRLLPALLRYLEDTGVGGERSSGKGQFAFQLEEGSLALPQPASPDAWVSLSHYLPTPEEVKGWQSAPRYTLVSWLARYESAFVGGQRVFKPLRRMLEPGSVFPLTERREVYGRLVRSGERLGHTVWVCGRALPAFAQRGGDL
ncbi:MAG: hypothetical protein HPY54_04945 [Chthonomonadetes bacterium]|nr:hypothetical protein [Chthonomonadetes bacterium]